MLAAASWQQAERSALVLLKGKGRSESPAMLIQDALLMVLDAARVPCSATSLPQVGHPLTITTSCTRSHGCHNSTHLKGNRCRGCQAMLTQDAMPIAPDTAQVPCSTTSLPQVRLCQFRS